MSAKKFKAIASVVVLVGMAKNCKRFFNDVCVDFFKSLQVTAARMIIHHSVYLLRFTIPSKRSTFNKRIISGKNFKAIRLVVFPVGVTKNF